MLFFVLEYHKVIAFHFMYGVGRLQQRTTCVFNLFQSYGNIAEKGCAVALSWAHCFCLMIPGTGHMFVAGLAVL